MNIHRQSIRSLYAGQTLREIVFLGLARRDAANNRGYSREHRQTLHGEYLGFLDLIGKDPIRVAVMAGNWRIAASVLDNRAARGVL